MLTSILMLIDPVRGFLLTSALATFTVFCVYLVLFYILGWLFRKFPNDLPLVILNVSRTPLLSMAILAGIKLAIQHLAKIVEIIWFQRVLDALIVILATYLFSQLFSQVCIYFLKDYAQKTEAVWDDVLVPILEGLAPTLIYVIGIFIFLETIGVDLTGIWVAFGGITFVLGFALRDILANFFSGLVLLIDTPFQFGDVISLPDGTIAVIKKIGLRVTQLYLVNTHSELYMPNSTLEGQDIINMSRPTTHYYYSINMLIRAEADAVKAARLMREIVLGHPDTLGEIDEKLKYLDNFGGLKESQDGKCAKQESGRIRLLAEKEVNKQLQKVEKAFDLLTAKVKQLEGEGGLNQKKLKLIESEYRNVLDLVGLDIVTEGNGPWQRVRLAEKSELNLQGTLIGLVRVWYQAWLQDPDLIFEDQKVLPNEWEQKIEILKLKMNKLLQKITRPSADKTRIDNYADSVVEWLHERFKQSKTEWQNPKIRINDVVSADGVFATEFIIKFYVDDIKLEHWERGYRVNSEVRREIVRQLRQAYLYW